MKDMLQWLPLAIFVSALMVSIALVYISLAVSAVAEELENTRRKRP